MGAAVPLDGTLSTQSAPSSRAKIYSPLVETKNLGPEIRMLTLRQPYAGLGHTSVRCRIDCVPLHDPGTFTALSYTWGDSSDTKTKTILINKIPVEVSDNLHDALKQFVTMNVERVWIDALCINQLDLEEKNRQVQYMKLIYSHATEVISWIGKPSDDSSQAMKLLRCPKPRNIWMPERGVTEEDRRQNWKVLDQFFDRPYWRRVWIVQEVAVAAKVRILCGEEEMSWDELATARTVYEKWKPAGLASKYRGGNYSYIEDITVFRERYRSKEPMGLLFALSKTQKALSTDERDKVYALVGLCFDGPTLVPSLNYDHSMEDIMRDLTGQMILTYGCLDVMLPGSWHLDSRSRHRPSWARDWLNRDVLNAFNNEVFPVAEETEPSWDFLLNERPPHWNILKIEGFVYETIRDCSTISTNAHPTALAPRRITNYYSGYLEFRDAVYESLFKTEGQHDYSCDILELEARRSFVDLARPQSKARDFDLRHFIHDLHTSSHQECGHSFESLGTERDSKTSHFEQFLCYHPDYEADFESTLFTAARKFLDEGLKLVEDETSYNGWGDPSSFQNVKAALTRMFKHSSSRQTQYEQHRILSRNFLSAALEKRKLVVLGNGQVARVNSHAVVGDKVCHIRGCSRPLVLRRILPLKKHVEGYLLVSDATLSYSEKDFLNRWIFASQSRDNWWDRERIRQRMEIFEVS